MTERDDGTERRVFHVFHWSAADYRVFVFFTFRIRNLQERNNQADQSKSYSLRVASLQPQNMNKTTTHDRAHTLILISCPCIWIRARISTSTKPPEEQRAACFIKPSPPGSSTSPTCHCSALSSSSSAGRRVEEVCLGFTTDTRQQESQLRYLTSLVDVWKRPQEMFVFLILFWGVWMFRGCWQKIKQQETRDKRLLWSSGRSLRGAGLTSQSLVLISTAVSSWCRL